MNLQFRQTKNGCVVTVIPYDSPAVQSTESKALPSPANAGEGRVRVTDLGALILAFSQREKESEKIERYREIFSVANNGSNDSRVSND